MTSTGLPAVARGTQTDVSGPQYQLMRAALDATGAAFVARGKLDIDGAVPSAPSSILFALAKRDFVTLAKIGHRVIGAWVTDLGVRKVAELDAEHARRERVAAAVRGF